MNQSINKWLRKQQILAFFILNFKYFAKTDNVINSVETSQDPVVAVSRIPKDEQTNSGHAANESAVIKQFPTGFFIQIESFDNVIVEHLVIYT